MTSDCYVMYLSIVFEFTIFTKWIIELTNI